MAAVLSNGSWVASWHIFFEKVIDRSDRSIHRPTSLLNWRSRFASSADVRGCGAWNSSGVICGGKDIPFEDQVVGL